MNETIADVLENGRELEYNKYVIEQMITDLGGHGTLAYTMKEADLPMYLIGLLYRKMRKVER